MGRIPRFAVVVWLLLVTATFGIGSATQAGPSVAVRDQRLMGNLVVVESVVASELGWVDIHAEAEVAGNPGAVIGYAPVQPGENNYVYVPVDSARVTPVLYAVLHVDRGQCGTFEFPGADEAVKLAGRSVTASFNVLDVQARPSSDAPMLAVRDQALRNGEVVIGRVVAAQDGWIDIHAEAEQAGNPGPVIGYSPVATGETTYVRVPAPAGAVTPVLYAVLHVDEGERGTFEFPGPDTPVQLEGRSIVAPFRLLNTAAQDRETPAASPTNRATASVTASATKAQATATRTQTTTQTVTPTATPTRASTATQTAAPTTTPTTTATAVPERTATATPDAQGAAINQSQLATPSQSTGTGDALGAAGGQASPPETLPLTGGGPMSRVELVPPALAGLSALLLLSGVALWRGRAWGDG